MVNAGWRRPHPRQARTYVHAFSAYETWCGQCLARRLETLEDQLSVRLFHTTGCGVGLILAGRELLEWIAPAIGEVAEALHGV